jgi:hypothetical protein
LSARETWDTNWRVLSHPAAQSVRVPRSQAGWEQERHRVRALPRGAAVVLLASGPMSSARSRQFARAAGVVMESQYLAFPSLTTPAYLVPDDRESIAYFAQSILAVPPRTTLLAWPLDRLLRMARSPRGWALIGRFAPGRISVGRRR